MRHQEPLPRVKALDCSSVKVGMQEVQRRTEELALEPAECTSAVSFKTHAEANAIQPSRAQLLGERVQKTELAERVTVTVDTDFAGDQVTRKSTTGVATFLGSHCVRTLQSIVILSSGEAEYYGIVKAMAMGFLMRPLLADLGSKWEHWSEEQCKKE
eukprot:2806772-Amphidinium_carterae.2